MKSIIKSEAEIELDLIGKEYFKNLFSIENKSHLRIRDLLWSSMINQLPYYSKTNILCFIENIQNSLNDENTPAKIKGFYKQILKKENIELNNNIFKVKFLIDGENVFYKKTFSGETQILSITENNAKEILHKIEYSINNYFKYFNYKIKILDIYISKNKFDECKAISVFFEEQYLPYKLF